MAVAMALAESTHHGAQRQKTARAGERHEMHYTATFRMRLSPIGAGQHLCLRLLAGRIGSAAHRGLDCRCRVGVTDSRCSFPVPQMVDQLLSFFTALDSSVPEQVIEVPKISTPSRCPRTVLSVPQMAEQLVEVPTIISFSSLRIVEQASGF